MLILIEFYPQVKFSYKSTIKGMKHLKNKIIKSRCHFKIILNSSIF